MSFTAWTQCLENHHFIYFVWGFFVVISGKSGPCYFTSARSRNPGVLFLTHKDEIRHLISILPASKKRLTKLCTQLQWSSYNLWLFWLIMSSSLAWLGLALVLSFLPSLLSYIFSFLSGFFPLCVIFLLSFQTSSKPSLPLGDLL